MTVTQPRSDHGTISRYKHYGCRCHPCTDAYRTYQRTYYRKRAYGTWQPYTDAEPVRQHIENLRTNGIGIDRIAEHAGLPLTSVSGLIYNLGPGHPRRKRIRPETAAKILAIRPEHVQPGVIDATGTHRRIQALAALGWPLKQLGPHLGVAPETVGRLLRQQRVYLTTANKVAGLYGRLWNTRPEDHGIRPTSAVRARQHAQKKGWVPPAAWDDIDDPGEQPQGVIGKPLGRDELAAIRREEIRHLAGFGIPAEQIAARLGIGTGTVRDTLRELRTGTRRNRQETAA